MEAGCHKPLIQCHKSLLYGLDEKAENNRLSKIICVVIKLRPVYRQLSVKVLHFFPREGALFLSILFLVHICLSKSAGGAERWRPSFQNTSVGKWWQMGGAVVWKLSRWKERLNQDKSCQQYKYSSLKQKVVSRLKPGRINKLITELCLMRHGVCVYLCAQPGEVPVA